MRIIGSCMGSTELLRLFSLISGRVTPFRTQESYPFTAQERRKSVPLNFAQCSFLLTILPRMVQARGGVLSTKEYTHDATPHLTVHLTIRQYQAG
jgi:hypothetical protein